MAGIIEKQAGRQVNAGSIRQQMAVPPELADTFEKLVAAGKRVMFSEQMAPEIAALMQGDGPPGQKIGQGVFGLVGLLVQKTNGGFPPQLVIPVAIELVGEAGDLLEDAGGEVTDADIAEGMAVVVEEILTKAGVSIDQLPQVLAGGQQPGPEQAPPQMGGMGEMAAAPQGA